MVMILKHNHNIRSKFWSIRAKIDLNHIFALFDHNTDSMKNESDYLK